DIQLLDVIGSVRGGNFPFRIILEDFVKTLVVGNGGDIHGAGAFFWLAWKVRFRGVRVGASWLICCHALAALSTKPSFTPASSRARGVAATMFASRCMLFKRLPMRLSS